MTLYLIGAAAFAATAALEVHRSLRMLASRQAMAAAESAGGAALFASLALMFAVMGF